MPNFDIDNFKKLIGDVESKGKYNILNNTGSSATGKYQFIWSIWKDKIKAQTGVESQDEFLSNPDAQEKFMDYVINNDYVPALDKLRKNNPEATANYNDEQLLALVHFQGVAGADNYLKTGTSINEKNNIAVEKYLTPFGEIPHQEPSVVNPQYKPLQNVKVGNVQQSPLDIDFSVSGENMKTENKVNYTPMQTPNVDTSFTGQKSLFKDGGSLYTYNGTNYKKEGDKWLKELNGKFVPMTSGNVQERYNVLNKNAKLVLSNEQKLDKWLGYPMSRASQEAVINENGRTENIDNVRHAVSAAYTAQALKDKGFPSWAAALGSMGLGVAHEASTYFTDPRWSSDDSFYNKFTGITREALEDIYNNTYGTYQWATSTTTPKVVNNIWKASAENKLTDGVAYRNFGNEIPNLYLKNDKGQGSFYNTPYKFEKGGPLINNFKLGGNMYRRFDLGGPMQGMPSEGQVGQLTSFDTGGSHEENGLGGIPQGMNPNGQQNLVEEGETKLNSKSYIFSDTLKLDKDTAKEFYFPNKYVGKTFAEISKLMDNSKSRRVNDSIEENAKRKDLDSLMYAQEEFKQKDLEKDMQNMMIKHPEFMQSMMAPQMPQEQPIDPSMMQQGTEQGLPMQSPMAKFGGYQNQMDFGGFMNKVGQVGKNYGLALADNALGAVGANNVIKDSDYAGAGADFARSAQKVTGAITNIGAGIATNALLPGVGGSVLGGVQGAMSGAGGENTVLQNGQVVPQRQMSNGGGLGKKLSFSLPTNLENDNFGIPVEGDTRLAFQLGDLSNDTFIAPEATPIAKNNSGILDVNYAGTEMSNMNPDAISKKDAKINKRLLKSTSNTNTDNTDNTDNTIDLENYFFDITDNTEDDNTKRTYDLEDGPQKQTYNQSLLNAAATYAPAVYNIGMGLFSKAQKLNPEDYINRTQIKNYRENINPQLRSSDEAMAGAKKGLRNSGASSGAYLANLQALHSQDQAMKAGLYANNENQYLARQLQVDQLNAARKDQANAMALQIADYNARAAAAKQKMLQEGISQVGNIAKSDTSNKLATMFNNLYAPDFKDYATYNSYLETLKKQAQNKKKKD